MQIEDIRLVIKEELSEHRAIDLKVHEAHHNFIQALIDRQTETDNLIKKVKESVVGWLAIVVLLGLGHAVWDYLKHVTEK